MFSELKFHHFPAFVQILCILPCFFAVSVRYFQMPGYRLGNVIYSQEGVNLFKCGVLCEQRADCTSINYNPGTKSCEMNNRVFLQPFAIIQESTDFSVYTKMRFCTSPPAVRFTVVNATIQASGYSVRYECRDTTGCAFEMVGSPLVMCLESGDWSTVSFFCKGRCYITSRLYNGRTNVTVSGRTCQMWALDTPQFHFNHIDFEYPEGSVSSAYNYCRNPDAETFVWCYTTDFFVRWEVCPVPMCPGICYMESNMFNEKISVTTSGRTCQQWRLDSPHAHSYHDAKMFPEITVSAASNYCRDPSGFGEPWCFTTDSAVRNETCGIPSCYDLC